MPLKCIGLSSICDFVLQIPIKTGQVNKLLVLKKVFINSSTIEGLQYSEENMKNRNYHSESSKKYLYWLLILQTRSWRRIC